MARSGAGTAAQQDSHPAMGLHARPGWPLVCVVQPTCRRVLAALSLTHDTPHYGPPSPGEGACACVEIESKWTREREERERAGSAAPLLSSSIFEAGSLFLVFNASLLVSRSRKHIHTHSKHEQSSSHTRTRSRSQETRAQFIRLSYIHSLSLSPPRQSKSCLHGPCWNIFSRASCRACRTPPQPHPRRTWAPWAPWAP